ncbi:hypothetical protein J5N97_023150 [Dioscorea zingiberensis]|uniref:UBC core domain-containing protein n=1 Tax=Dioscorea zingiberensis TaxID=325984 RepID=A0A9D5CBS3_9LILI|nr:hypothetical protein J5N97_023150 [Dioscorea zingiberensis]
MDYKVESINDEMDDFIVDFHGHKDSLYEGGLWKVRVLIPDGYPYKPPTILFTNKIYHPNENMVCLNAIDEAWSPIFCLMNAFEVFLPQLLLDPNPSDPFNKEAAALMMSDLAVYELTVKEYCEKYPKPDNEAVSSEEKTTDEELSEADAHSSDEAVVAKPNI